MTDNNNYKMYKEADELYYNEKLKKPFLLFIVAFSGTWISNTISYKDLYEFIYS